MTKKKSKGIFSFLLICAMIVMSFGIVVLVYFLFSKPFNDGSGCPDVSLFSSYGTFIGGFVGSLFSLSGFLLLFETLRAQREAMDAQKNEFHYQHQAIAQERFEMTFFNLLQVQQKILDDLKIEYLYLNKESGICTEEKEKQDVFKYLLKEIKHIDNSLTNTYYNGMYDSKTREWEEAIADAHEQLKPQSDGDDRLEKEIERIRTVVYRQFTNLLYDITQTRWNQSHSRDGKHLLQTVYYFLFNRYNFALGHYFRHLYRILKFIRQYEIRSRDMAKNGVERNSISNQCREYAQLVQAQMSAYELAMLYYNALCYPKMAALVKEYGLLENFSIFDLARPAHYIKEEGYNIKSERIVPA